jgi:hypothetical protein
VIEAGTFSAEGLAEVAARYELLSAGADWIADLKARFGLKLLRE